MTTMDENPEAPTPETPALETVGRPSRFLLWCAGSDLELLETPAERTKQAGLGTLVLIPALLASFAMTYAISTLTTNLVVPILAGLAWALIVFCFDRYVVSTFRKSASLWADLASPIFLTRFILAGFIGLIVAHPLVLLYFEDSIDQQLQVERAASLEAIEASFGPRFDRIEASRGALRQEIQEKEQIRLEAQSILMEEVGGIESGRTTGRVGRGPAAQAQERLRDMADQDLVTLRAELQAQDEALRRESADLVAQRQLERGAPQARDYIARSQALEALRAQSLELTRVHAFLILFFVFVDTLPLLFKTLTPRGPYDERLMLQEETVFSQVEKSRWKLRSVYQEIDRARSGGRGRSEVERRGIAFLYGELMGDLEEHQNSFRESLRRQMAEAANGLNADQEELAKQALAEMDEANLRVVTHSLERFQEAFLTPKSSQPETINGLGRESSEVAAQLT
ncbi:MAG: DUF4407 domain-containing protein [Deltaproteobacteria bacterium]|nr:DUF4407 domain-containing protein [Deltaproteobacteria bacterium]